MDVYIHGHGKWKLESGNFSLPRGCKVTFYTQFAKTLMPTEAMQILEGTYNEEAEREIGEFRNLPNLSISPLSDNQWNKAITKWQGGSNTAHLLWSPMARTTLKDAVDAVRKTHGLDGTYHFHWVCCQALDLKNTELGGKVGVNARHLTSSHQFQLVDRTKPRGSANRYLGLISE